MAGRLNVVVIGSGRGETDRDMHLTKHHGLLNDFLVVLDETNPAPVPVDADLARRLCDRRSGLGADGLIHGARPPGSDDADGVDVVMHLFNADGSRAEMSGNGIRCLAHAVSRARGLTEGIVRADTDTGRRDLAVRPGRSRDEVMVRVDLGEVRTGPSTSELDVPVPAKEVAGADIGNPHLVVLLDAGADADAATALAELDLVTVGQAIEAQVPGGVNVEVIVPGVEPDTLDLRVWERGAGLTAACGTGASVAAHLARTWGLVGDEVTVRMPGGAVVVELIEGRAVLRGPSVLVADLELSAEGVVVGG